MSLIVQQCPSCGSRDLRYSRVRTFRERMAALAGVHPLRCRHCRLRFVRRTWALSELRYARCPRCLRMDLSRWSLEDYDAPLGRRLVLALGAKPYRCEYCRLNFAAFRQRIARSSQPVKTAARGAR